MGDGPLAGRTVAITADRRQADQADMLRRRGAEVIVGATMRTVDLADDVALRAATESVIAEPPDVFVATTGYGVRLWLEAADGWGLRDDVVGALGSARRFARGAKARSALNQAGIGPEWVAPDEAMDTVVEHLTGVLGGTERVSVQLFDPDEHPTTQRLRSLAGSLVELPVYRWLLPHDLDPARRVIDGIIDRSVDAVTFTSQPAVRHLFRIAEHRAPDLAAAFAEDVLAVCIGDVCAEALVECGVDRYAVPTTFRLKAMIDRLAEAMAD